MTIATHPTLHRSWNIRLLLFGNGLVALLLLSLFLPYTSDAWQALDVTFFRLINAPLEHSPKLRVFWAIANHRLADWVEDLCFLGLYLVAIWKAPKGERKTMGVKLFTCVLLTALTILLVNRLLCRDLLRVRRQSPTNMVEGAVFLSDFISWMSVKVNSAKSFPGDHATTALMVTLSYAYLVRGRLAFLALLYGAFLCLPRLAAGAHWLSDIMIGSLSIVLFSFSWAFFTPLFSKIVAKLSRFVKNAP